MWPWTSFGLSCFGYFVSGVFPIRPSFEQTVPDFHAELVTCIVILRQNENVDGGSRMATFTEYGSPPKAVYWSFANECQTSR